MSEPIMRKVARAIADQNGDDFDAIPRNKSHWIQERGMFGGRSRDCNEPYQPDYDGMAEAAVVVLCEEAEQEALSGVLAFLWHVRDTKDD